MNHCDRKSHTFSQVLMIPKNLRYRSKKFNVVHTTKLMIIFIGPTFPPQMEFKLKCGIANNQVSNITLWENNKNIAMCHTLRDSKMIDMWRVAIHAAKVFIYS